MANIGVNPNHLSNAPRTSLPEQHVLRIRLLPGTTAKLFDRNRILHFKSIKQEKDSIVGLSTKSIILLVSSKTFLSSTNPTSRIQSYTSGENSDPRQPGNFNIIPGERTG